MKTRVSLLIAGLILFSSITYAQACTPAGNQTSYGTNNVWIGYIYDNLNFVGYNGYVNEGTTANPNFDENFGGDNNNYLTLGCPVYTETFSARYKLAKNFADGDYQFTVGADDGYRLSLDGGATWAINQWNDQGYTTTTYTVHLNGNYNMVLEYYENAGGNRVSFTLSGVCVATDDQTIYGTGNVWKGYIYGGTSFNTYKGNVLEGSVSNPGFDEAFGGSNTTYNTATCSIQTESFSARYRLRRNFSNGTYIFVLGGDDGYRLSLDGGATWVINRWADQSYNTTGYTTTLSGFHDMVIEYYENGGDNRISFSVSPGVLPINLLSFDGVQKDNKILLNWQTTLTSTIDHFEIERSADNSGFTSIGEVAASESSITGNTIHFDFTDNNRLTGISFYRLKMVDVSGVITYSKILSISLADRIKPVHIYPTISTGSFTIVSSDKLVRPSINLFDVEGRKIFTKQLDIISPNIPSHFSVTEKNLVRGIYLLQILERQQIVATTKIILE